jgi:hypothetical protein
MTNLRTPREWAILHGVRVADPDGWRDEGVSFDEPCTEDVFIRRLAQSTVILRPSVPTVSELIRDLRDFAEELLNDDSYSPSYYWMLRDAADKLEAGGMSKQPSYEVI